MSGQHLAGSTLLNYLKEDQQIIDLGSGPNGAHWWGKILKGSRITAFDLYNKPDKIPDNITFIKQDVCKIKLNREFYNSFDLAVADHIFEHVSDTEGLAQSISLALREGGFVHIGIPDATNFTDRFYRLIHRDGGGHISQFTKDSMIRLMDKYRFDLVEVYPWPDDWRWFDSLYSLKNYQIEHLTAEEVKYMANVFRKELTPEKGYYYGWEFMFKKR